MKTANVSINIVVLVLLSILGSACGKKDGVSAQIDELRQEHKAKEVIADKELDLKIATVKAGKSLPTPIVINPNPSPQKVQVELIEKSNPGTVKVEVVKPIPTEPVPSQDLTAIPAKEEKPVVKAEPAPTPPVVKVEAPAAPAPVATPTQVAAAPQQVTTTVEISPAPAPTPAPAPVPPVPTSLANTLGQGGKQ